MLDRWHRRVLACLQFRRLPHPGTAKGVRSNGADTPSGAGRGGDGQWNDDCRKRRVTFEVDSSQLFDTLRAMKGDTGPLGARLVAALLAQPCTADLIGMAVYGVEMPREENS